MDQRFQSYLISGFLIAVGVYFSFSIPRTIIQGIASGKFGDDKRKMITLMKVLGYLAILCGVVVFVIETFVGI